MTASDRLALLRATARDYQGELTTRIVQRLYTEKFGPGDWRRSARLDLAYLAEQGLLICDTTDPGRRCYRFNQVGAPRG